MKFQANSKSEFRSETTKPEKGSGRPPTTSVRDAASRRSPRHPAADDEEGRRGQIKPRPYFRTPSVRRFTIGGPERLGPLPGECTYFLLKFSNSTTSKA